MNNYTTHGQNLKYAKHAVFSTGTPILPEWRAVEPHPWAAFVVGLLLCGPLLWVVLILFFSLPH